ncbi:SEL1-like repeat protein, partial [Klebsiella pneumoniae]
NTSVAWYEKIPDRDYRFTESRLSKVKKSRDTLADLNARVQKGDAEAAYELSYAWRNGNHGLTQDPKKSRYYLKMAAKGGNEDAITTLIDDYKSADTLSPEDKKLLLSLYDKLPG